VVSIRTARNDLEKALIEIERLNKELKESRRLCGIHRTKLRTRDTRIQVLEARLEDAVSRPIPTLVDGCRQAVKVKQTLENKLITSAWVKS